MRLSYARGTLAVAIVGLLAVSAAPANDDCANAIPIYDGVTSYDTTGANTDGPAHPGDCQHDGQTYHDIWYTYEAICTGPLTVSVCQEEGGDAWYDTDLVVYDGCDCDNLVLLGCNDDAEETCTSSGTVFGSRVEVSVVEGNCYLIRVGGYGHSFYGAGDLSIVCVAEGLGACCNPATGECTPDMTEPDCDGLYGPGNWIEGKTCEPNPCPPPPPANDTCLSATEVVSMPFDDLDVQYESATDDDIDISCNDSSCTMVNNGVWYTYTPDQDCTMTIHVTAADYEDTVTAVFTGTGCEDLAEVYCSDPQETSYGVTSGTQYWILIGKYSCSSEPDEPISIAFDCTPLSAGDDCDEPLVVTLSLGDLPYTDTNYTCGRADDYGDTCLGYYDGGEDIIYEVTLTEALQVDITLDPLGTTYSGIAIDTVCPPGATCLAYHTNIGSGPHGFLGLDLAAGTYYIMIATWPYPDCIPEFDLTIADAAPLPPNDDCDEATFVTEIDPNAPLAFDTRWATFDGLGGCMSSSNIWYCYTASYTSDVIISLMGSSYDTNLAVYDGCTCDPLGTELCCNDTYGGTLQSQCTVPVVAGNEYLIEVGGYGSNTGPGVLSIYFPTGACCVGEDCVATNTGPECAALDGDWYIGEDCFDSPPFECPEVCPESTIDIRIMTDYLPFETTWQVTDNATGTVLCSGGPYSENAKLYIERCCIGYEDCVDFTIYDSYGDGINAPGGYALYLDGELICSNIGTGWIGSSQTQAGIGGGCVGACCVDVDCVATTSRLDCLDNYAGEWYVAEDCFGTPPFECPVRPPNDDCEDAELVNAPYPATTTGDTTLATLDCPGFLDWDAVWYDLQLPYASNNVVVTICPTTVDLWEVSVVLMDDCDCDDYILYSNQGWLEPCPSGYIGIEIRFNGISGFSRIYYPAYVEPVTFTGMPFEITFDVTEVITPPNDDCEDAEPVGDVVDLPFDTTGASFDGAGTCMSSPNIWYCYTATCYGEATISLLGSTYDTMLAVYDGCTCDPLGTQLCCNNDYGRTPQSECHVSVAPGNTYLIEVGGYSANAGPGMLNISCDPYDFGACCVDSVCTEQYEMDCAAMDGLFGGDGSACSGLDCNANGRDDTCDILEGISEDCQPNGVPDECDIADGTSPDANGNGVPDECEQLPVPPSNLKPTKPVSPKEPEPAP